MSRRWLGVALDPLEGGGGSNRGWRRVESRLTGGRLESGWESTRVWLGVESSE